MLVRRSVDGHDSGNIEFHISNFRYPVLGEYERINAGYGKPFVAIFNNCIYCIQFLKYAHKRQQFIVQ